MFGRPKPLISDALYDWIVDNVDWVTTHRPHWHDRATNLVLPTKAFFDAPNDAGHETALRIMVNIKERLGLETPIDLKAQEVLPDELRHKYGKLSDVAGQFMQDGNASLITYDPTLLRKPIPFINVMCHELLHARLAGLTNALPGGDEMHELATDLHCIIAGFGLFQLEGHEQSGWSGYMSQPARATALAIYLRFHDLKIEAALPYLSRRPANWLRKAWAYEATNAP